jgi:hypothetical protein
MIRRLRGTWQWPVCLCCISLGLALLYLSNYNVLAQIPPVYGYGYGYDNSLTVQFSASEYYVAEDGGTATILVTLSAPSSQTVTVDYSTSDGTATAPTDYLPASGTLTFAPGQTSASFQVTINNAGFSQNLYVNLTLGNVSGDAELGEPFLAELTIVAPNYAPSVQFQFSNFYVSEDDGSATVTVTLSDACSQPVSVAYNTGDGTATAPTDYLPASGTLRFSPNQTSATFQVTINNVGFSQNLTVNLALSNPAGGATMGSPPAAVLTITPPDTTCPN